MVEEILFQWYTFSASWAMPCHACRKSQVLKISFCVALWTWLSLIWLARDTSKTLPFWAPVDALLKGKSNSTFTFLISKTCWEIFSAKWVYLPYLLTPSPQFEDFFQQKGEMTGQELIILLSRVPSILSTTQTPVFIIPLKERLQVTFKFLLGQSAS